MALNRAVFWDKDGTLVEDVPYNVDPSAVRFMEGAFEALRRLQEGGYRLVIVSNQPGIAHGLFGEEELRSLCDYLRAEFGREGIGIDGIYCCPHHPDGKNPTYTLSCRCRKPGPGMLFQASLDLDLSLERSWMIGDILHDVECGNRAGCRSLLFDNGNESEWVSGRHRIPFATVHSLSEAANVILDADDAKKMKGK